MIQKIKEQLINKVKEQLMNKVKEQLINKVKEQLIKATNQLLRFLKKPKSLRHGLSIKYVHLLKEIKLPDTPFMNP